MKTLWQDVRFAARMLWKNPPMTFVAIVALALGVGANTAIFSVVNAVLLRPLPFAEPDRLVVVFDNFLKMDLPRISVSVPEFIDYRERAESFEHLAAFTNFSANLAASDGREPERIEGLAATPELFSVLRVNPFRGRVFTAEEDRPGQSNVVVLSHGLWQRRFGGDASLVGQSLLINGESHMVVGIMPPGFAFPQETELWAPIAFSPTQLAQNQRGSRFLSVVGRLKPDVTLAQAQAETDGIAQRLEEQYPQNYSARKSGWAVSVIPLLDVYVGNLRPALFVLLGAVVFVLLIACANVANLLLARAAARQKELALRTALGAGRWRLVRQLLTESMMLALLGGLGGLLLAMWGIDLLVRFTPEGITRLSEVGLDKNVLAFTFLISLVTGVVFGLAPALQASQPDINETLKEGGRSATGSTNRRRFRSALIVSEVALALVLLIGAGLLLKSFRHLQGVDPGFDADNVLTMRVPLPATTYAEPALRRAFYQRTLERIAALPGVEAASAASLAPLSQNNSSGTTTAENSAVGPSDLGVEADWRWVTPDYFRALDIRLIKGRLFTAQDGEGAQPVAIVDESFARRFYPNEEAVGKRVKRGGFASQNSWMTIVGVVRYVRHRRLDADSHVQIYFPYYQDPAIPATMSLVVRTNPATAPMSLAAAVRAAVQDADRNQPVFNVRTMREIVAESLAQQRMSMILLGTFAGVALMLAAVGVYGLMNYTVASRTHEIGIRMALGAQERDVLRLIVRQGMALTLAGVGAGLLGAAAVTRVMASLLYGVSTSDAFIFASVPLLLTAVAFVACLVPARRAMRVEPVTALRYE